MQLASWLVEAHHVAEPQEIADIFLLVALAIAVRVGILFCVFGRILKYYIYIYIYL